MTPKARDKVLESLEALGFTRVEAEMYVFLLRESPATGYGIAQGLNKAVGHVYKAIDALEAKGAVVTTLDESQNRLCRAVPVSELLASVKRRTADQCEFLLEQLPPPSADPSDDRVYRISDREQFFQRCRRMMKSARAFALLTVCPGLVEEVYDELGGMVRRGVVVGLKVFKPVEVAGATVIVDPRGESAVQTGPGQWLFLTVDGREFMQALFDMDAAELLHAAWSESALMTWAFYTGLSSDLVLAAVREAVQRGESFEHIKKLLEQLRILESPHSSGKKYLIERHRKSGRK